jgi:thymidine kinase
MSAGKSLALLSVAHNYEERGHQVVCYTARIADRDGVGVIATRAGLTRPASTFDGSTVFDSKLLGRPACVLIDEGQFLSRAQVRQLHKFAHVDRVPVLVYGLRTDFRGELFDGAAMLLGLADVLDELRTICSCGRKATMNARLTSDGERVTEGPQVEIGGNARYKAVCARCFYVGSSR